MAVEDRAELSLRLANALLLFWEKRDYYSEGRHFLARVLEQVGERGNITMRARALSGAGRLAQKQNDYPAAQAFYEESLHLYQKFNDKAGVAEALRNLGIVFSSLGNPTEARTYYEQSLCLQRELGDQGNIARTLGNLGNLARLSISA